MLITNNYTRLLIVTGSLLFSVFTSCKKDGQEAISDVDINLPSTLTLNYGEEKDLDIPAELLGRTDLNFTLEFTETENNQINTENRLYDKLAKAITVNRAQGKIHVNSNFIYPNGAVSSVTGQKLPESYKITVIANSENKTRIGKKTVAITVTPAKFNIKGADNKAEIPYAYVLYNNAGATFELEPGTLSLDGTSWYLDSKGAETVVSLSGNKIQFKGSAGDPAKKTEKAYDLTPSLKKDGFDIASRPLRVIFIPQIKFFYGAYYPELDLTILLNLVHIGLSNAYVSAAPVLYPENYKSTFSLTSIEKDGKAFEDKDGIFEVNDKTGIITVKKNTTLTAGSYKLSVKATTTTGLEFPATMTLEMSKLTD
ncbi:hypothetical protein [Filimonas effusa]|uniref:Uncharacterized protein n=1 Tax=Filimonas effusa TaxID=2508721 RepID=A0A4Q1DAF9_9BACT|nr:hypothetical protein [Filimonas effusa]RXK86381.1 hypothetical protein ESB13_06135 [Filimonas effusa]